jgi:hypothetical protein
MSLPGVDNWIQGSNVCERCHLSRCVCTPERTDVPETLDRVTDTVLAYKPKPKTKAAKRRIRRKKRQLKERESSI